LALVLLNCINFTSVFFFKVYSEFSIKSLQNQHTKVSFKHNSFLPFENVSQLTDFKVFQILLCWMMFWSITVCHIYSIYANSVHSSTNQDTVQPDVCIIYHLFLNCGWQILHPHSQQLLLPNVLLPMPIKMLWVITIRASQKMYTTDSLLLKTGFK
jgi:hypothetical protein